MTSGLLAVTYDVHDPEEVGRFWGAVLGREPVPDGAGVLLAGDDAQVGLRFLAADRERVGPNRLHLHLTSTSREDMDRTIARVLELGGRHLDVGQLPEEGHVVLADPEGHELCVIPPDSTFLAGTGFLGEVACDGTREVGHFWAAALKWPLVWDQDEETAIQSPQGGTKIAWGGPPVEPRHGRNRQRFELVTADVADVDAEAERLVGLGATVLGDTDDGLELADPDGNEFTLRPTAG